MVAEGISVRGLEEIVSVGDGDRRSQRARGNRATAPGLAELADRLGDRLETRVKVALGKSRGKVTIEFASLSQTYGMDYCPGDDELLALHQVPTSALEVVESERSRLRRMPCEMPLGFDRNSTGSLPLRNLTA